jgi:hypothetical protein
MEDHEYGHRIELNESHDFEDSVESRPTFMKNFKQPNFNPILINQR